MSQTIAPWSLRLEATLLPIGILTYGYFEATAFNCPIIWISLLILVSEAWTIGGTTSVLTLLLAWAIRC